MALFGNDTKKKKAAKDAKAKDAPKRLIPEDNLAELTKFFDGMQEPVELLVFTDADHNAPYNSFMESLCRELAELAPKITARFLSLDSEEAKSHGVDFSPTLLLSPARYHIRYLGAPLGEEARTLIETIMRVSLGKSGLTQISRQLLQELEEKRDVRFSSIRLDPTVRARLATPFVAPLSARTSFRPCASMPPSIPPWPSGFRWAACPRPPSTRPLPPWGCCPRNASRWSW